MIKKIRVFWNWLGDVSLRLILLVGMIVVFSSGVYLSWRHTLHMAERHGFTADEALIYTILVETLLAVAEIVVIFRATMSKPIHASVYVGVGLSAIINLVGNVSSFWSISRWGVALGASITAITAIAVWIFATALAESDKRADRQETDKTNGITTDIDKPTSDSEQDSLADRQDKLKTMGGVGTVLSGQDSNIDSQTETDDATSKDRQDRNATIDKTTKTDTNKTADATTQTDTQDKTATNRQTRDITTRLTSKTKTRSTIDAKSSKTKLSVIKGSQTNDKDELARQKAMDYFNQTGKFPSYRQLGEMAGMSKDKAGEIIKSLKKKVG